MSKLPINIPAPRGEGSTTDWRKAFAVLVLLLSREFINSGLFSTYVDTLRDHCGDEAADFMVAVFNSNRSPWVQSLMG